MLFSFLNKYYMLLAQNHPKHDISYSFHIFVLYLAPETFLPINSPFKASFLQNSGSLNIYYTVIIIHYYTLCIH